MPSLPQNPTPIEASLLNATLTEASELANELKAAKENAKTDGHHNLVLVNQDNPAEPQVYELKVSESQLDNLALGQQVAVGKISGTIKFMDHGADDGIAPTTPAAPKTPTAKDPYARTQQEASELILAYTVWGLGSEDDEDQFKRSFSEREQQQMIKEFQTEIGANPSGSWDEQTFVKAKDYLVNNYDAGEHLNDAQFTQFLGDLTHYRKGELSREQVAENLDGYLYDLRQHPYHRPASTDPAGFAAFHKNLSADDQALLPLALEATEPEEAEALMKILTGKTPAAEAKAWLLAEYYDAEEIPGVMTEGANVPAELSKLFYQDMQQYLGLPEEKRTGQLDQQTYDALAADLYEEYELDMGPEQLRAFTQDAVKAMLAYSRGQLNDEQLDAQLAKLAGK